MSSRIGAPRVLIGVLAFVVFQAGMTNVGADTASDLEQARQRVAATQAEANDAAAELDAVEGRRERLVERVDQLAAQIRSTQERTAELERVVRERAVAAYTGGSASRAPAIFSAGSAVAAMRRVQLLNYANREDNVAVSRLAALRTDLKAEQTTLESQREDLERITEELKVRNAAVQEGLAAANHARDELVARLERERAAAAAAELARVRAEQAASQVRAPGGSAGQVIANPGGGAFQCPVGGSAYTSGFGPRGGSFHYGIDMLASSGVPEVAVKPGYVTYVPMAGAGGNEAYLAANDGNVYYYAHMSSFVGGSRSVAQGEIIGLVGSTGNSTAPHLHFEIRLGGANGQRMDPYPTLRAAGC